MLAGKGYGLLAGGDRAECVVAQTDDHRLEVLGECDAVLDDEEGGLGHGITLVASTAAQHSSMRGPGGKQRHHRVYRFAVFGNPVRIRAAISSVRALRLRCCASTQAS